MTKSSHSKAGFTLLEILLVVGIIAILAGIVILAINPTKQLGDARNAQRRSDILTILNGIYQYSIDNNGTLPASSTLATETNTCSSSDTDAKALDTYLVTASSTYMTGIPEDPSLSSVGYVSGTSASGYYVSKLSTGRIMVCAPSAESGVTINVTR